MIFRQETSMKYPLISIVTPSYNQGIFLENTIASVIEQGYPNLEYIVMDGGSSDGSMEIIRKYAKYLAYWQSQPDGGQVAAINAGFRKAGGEVFAFLNSDDFLLQGAIQHMVELYNQYPQAPGWTGGGYSITQDGFILQTRITPPRLEQADLADWEENWIYQPGCFFSAPIALAVGLFNPAYQNSFDFDFWMRIVRLGRLIPTPRIIAAATIHSNTKTQKYHTRMFEETQAIQRAYGYANFAEKTQKFIDQARQEKPGTTVAKLLYETHTQKRKFPNRFVRFPEKPTVP
jgi:glycosyltransferase involved in cell wall biosynthesis